jgi:hypothetical protein
MKLIQRYFVSSTMSIVVVGMLFVFTAQVALANSSCIADLNVDGRVGLEDYSLLSNNFFTNSTQYDITGDAYVDISDYSIMASSFFSVCNQDPSGENMPVGDLQNWRLIYSENFDQAAAEGQFAQVYQSSVRVYPDGWPDTAGQQGAPSRYYPSKVLRAEAGKLIKNIRYQTIDGVDVPMGAAVIPKIFGESADEDQLYGKYTVRFRVINNAQVALSGYKVAWLLWPDSGVWPRDGEIDFPEGNLDQTIEGFVHKMNATQGSDQDAFTTDETFDTWHTASIEWLPDRVTFILDGVEVGTSTDRIPEAPMHWVLQTESCLNTDCPHQDVNADVEIDWIVVYSPL